MPQLITYTQFLELAQEDDVRALTLFAGGEVIHTQSTEEAASFTNTLDRLWLGGTVTRVKSGREEIGDQTWFTFEARVKPAALVYVANAAKERLVLSRVPLP